MGLILRWRRWHDQPRLKRGLLKVLAFAALTLIVLFPKPWLIVTLISRAGDLNGLLGPADPRLSEYERLVRAQVPEPAPVGAALPVVERVVLERMPYAWDWDNWGVMEYLPTAGEALQRGREDCDGRAVVAASLLRRLGYEAWLVTDVLHMWVETPGGALMNPTGGDKTLVSSRGAGQDPSTRLNLTAGVVPNLARGLAFGVAVFPLGRELIILGGLVLLTLQPRSSGRRRLAGILMLIGALVLLRAAGQQAALTGQPAAVSGALLAALLAVCGWLLLAVRAAGRRPRSAPVRSG